VHGHALRLLVTSLRRRESLLALRLYAQAMRRGEEKKAALKAVVQGIDWHDWAQNALRRGRPANRPEPREQKNPAVEASHKEIAVSAAHNRVTNRS
jgi:hypothetical protein